MKTKHWAAIGLSLIVVNATLLRGARAAELAPVFHRPVFRFLEAPFFALWGKPQPIILSPVTVRLFSNQKLNALWIKNLEGFKVGKRRVKGSLFIELQGRELSVVSDGRRLLSGHDLTFQATGNAIYELKARHDRPKWTRGDLHLRVVKEHIQVVNRLGLEDYVSGIVEGELGSLDLSPEVLKAQIIVARSYVLAMRGEQHHGEGFEFCDHPHCQVYKGIPMNHPAFDAAIRSVRGQYISYKGHPIAAFYHHDCGGMTSAVQDVWPAPARPYLVAVKEPVDSFCRTSSTTLWRASFSRKSLAVCFRNAGWISKREALDTLRVVQMDPSCRAKQILVESQTPKWIPAPRFRNVVNQFVGREVLKSAMFTISLEGDTFVFRGRGWGHGVGLCQEGAMWMSRHGKTYQEILQHYFPHTEIATLR